MQINANNKSDSDVRPLLLGEGVVVVLVVDIVVGAVVVVVLVVDIVIGAVVGGVGNEGTNC